MILRRVRLAAVLLGTAALALTSVVHPAQAADAYQWKLPRGFPEPAVPADNPMSAAKVALGRQLFADTRLSVTGRYSCQSCHSPERAFTDGLARSRGATGETLPLNAPTLLNAAYNASLGWSDARVHTFEQQMRGPLFNEHPVELGLAGREAGLERTLLADAALTRAFEAAFPGETRAVTTDNVIRAIAAYLRTLLSASSRFDRYVFAGEHDALDAAQKRGMELFFSTRSGCAVCHGGINFAGAWVDSEHAAATPVFADTGTGQLVRVPSLRNLAATAPYMHDGRFATLDAVLDHYEKLAIDPGAEARLRRPQLTTQERGDLEQFLGSLNDAR
jgi:cytochrome c peroxidase